MGPYPWREQPSAVAMSNACELVRACVLAGYNKIHLDASMACGDDSKNGPDESTVAQRAAILCRAAESTFKELPSGFSPPLYVIGTEVPAPGGELLPGAPPAAISSADHLFITHWKSFALPLPNRIWPLHGKE